MTTDDLFTIMYNHYMPTLRLIVKRHSVPISDIDDIVQDVFLTFYTHYPLTWSEQQIYSMLTKITCNRCADYFRAQSNYSIVFDSDNYLMNFALNDDPVDIIIRQQKNQLINDMLKTMKKKWRLVYILYIIHERPISEISKMLGISESACRTRLMKGRDYMKNELEKRKGVTLVEVITVMVILSVLTAVIVPSLLGSIRKVKEQQYVMEAYNVKSSAQMYVTERYADETLDDHRVMMKMIEGNLTSDKHVLFPYLRIKCSPGAQLKGATFKIDTGVLQEIVYQVGKYKITLNEDGEHIEIVTPSPR